MKLRTALLSTLAMALLAGFTIVSAQQAGDAAIGGYCPVAYKMAKMPVKGDPAFVSTYDGQTFQLANAMAKQMFDKAPADYAPAYHGYCATAVAKGMKVTADPALFSVVNGKTYLFSTAMAKEMFDKDQKNMIAMADKNWPTVAKAKPMQ
jgi:YHS domain-containing protein